MNFNLEIFKIKCIEVSEACCILLWLSWGRFPGQSCSTTVLTGAVGQHRKPSQTGGQQASWDLSSSHPEDKCLSEHVL